MPAEARITSVWYKQKLFVALFLLGIGAWFYWDGFVGYPRSNERFLVHQDLVKNDHEGDWPAVAGQKGWTTEVPHKLYNAGEVRLQWICGTFASLLGIISLVYWFTQKSRILRTDDEAVYSPAGTRVPFQAITGLGKKKWEAKGLATVLYEIDGRTGRFVLDDYKFDYEATHQILTEIEEKLTARVE